MKIAIGAIFRDEYDYIIEWIAWHQMAGFYTFYIADNGSTDGTTALLEALADLGHIKLIYQPVLEKHAQIVAYRRIMQQAISETEAILFIDADEFTTHESMEDGAEARLLQELFLDKSVGVVCINWRTFGSSSDNMVSEPVVCRFNYHASDEQDNPNRALKSIARISLLAHVDVHVPLLSTNFDYMDSEGFVINDFLIKTKSDLQKCSSRRANTCKSPLRLNHYVIKSEQEFMKKRTRGCAMSGASFDRGMSFFYGHDFKDDFFKFPIDKIERLKLRMDKLGSEISTSHFNRLLRGAVDSSNHVDISGWCIDTLDGLSDSIKINIFVNGIYQGSTHCGFYRPDLLEKGISKTGMSGFRWTHAKPLNAGDVVEVKVHANRFKFPQRAYTVIE